MKTAPIVLLTFNRPQETALVFERIREIRPECILHVSDGARPARPGEAELVEKTRRIISEGIDWKCRLETNYSEVNMGCRERVASGISWAFSLVDEAIILEDDCLPNPTFFRFCTELLERYRNDADVWHINGTNLAALRTAPGGSYRFSRHAWMWGWATWKRAWDRYDTDMKSWNESDPMWRGAFSCAWESAYWKSVWREFRNKPGGLSSWDFQWMHTLRKERALSIMPCRNLVRNLGFGSPQATHTHQGMGHLRNREEPCDFPLRHPAGREVSDWQDARFTRAYHDGLAFRAELETFARVLFARR